MREVRRVRLIRKNKSQAESGSSTEAAPLTSQPSDREIKNRRIALGARASSESEEFRLTFAALLKGAGFQVPSR